MTLPGYLCYFVLVILADLVGTRAGLSMGPLYFLLAILIFCLSLAGKILACRNGTGSQDRKRAELMDNSVTKPAKNNFLYLTDCSSRSLILLELPYLLCLVGNIIYNRFFL